MRRLTAKKGTGDGLQPGKNHPFWHPPPHLPKKLNKTGDGSAIISILESRPNAFSKISGDFFLRHPLVNVNEDLSLKDENHSRRPESWGAF